jgi:hypothetical protein
MIVSISEFESVHIRLDLFSLLLDCACVYKYLQWIYRKVLHHFLSEATKRGAAKFKFLYDLLNCQQSIQSILRRQSPHCHFARYNISRRNLFDIGDIGYVGYVGYVGDTSWARRNTYNVSLPLPSLLRILVSTVPLSTIVLRNSLKSPLFIFILRIISRLVALPL